MKKQFWKMAHRRYHKKKLKIITEVAMFTWGVFFLIVYTSAFLSGWRPGNAVEVLVGIVLTFSPLVVGIMHWRIRAEASKGDDALYRKLVSVMHRNPS